MLTDGLHYYLLAAARLSMKRPELAAWIYIGINESREKVWSKNPASVTLRRNPL
jgi:hypothetical protein